MYRMERKAKNCPDCGKTYPASGFYKNRARGDGLSVRCRVCHTAENRRVGPVSVRREVVEALGGKCVTCGFSDVRALHVDHVNSDGKEHRKGPDADKSPFQYYKSMLNGKSKFELQLLCANCSAIKMDELQERNHPDRRTYLAMPEPLSERAPNAQHEHFERKRQEARGLAMMLGMKVCSKCKTSKSLGAFYKDKKRPDGLYPYCKDCHTTSIADSKARRAIA
jgi:hypothetical protein